MATHVVIKAFDGAPGVRYVPGQVVDATAWPRVHALIAARYIRARTVEEAMSETAAAPQQKTRPGRGKG